MPKRITGKKLASNVLISLVAQLVATAIGLLLHLVVPKFIDDLQYSYWQSYVLYSGYVGVLHFGLLDGILLRYAKYDYEELDKARLRSQFLILLCANGAMTLLGAAAALLFCSDPVIRLTVILVACAVLTKNAFTYSSYTLQITNRINRYAAIVIMQKLVYGAVVTVLLFCRVNQFVWYCLADLLGDVCGFLLSNFLAGNVFYGKGLPLREALKECRVNISAGIILMLANWSSILLVSSAKMIVQWHWGDLTFGKVSFAFTVTNMFLTFISAVSVVLFPSLKRVGEDRLAATFSSVRDALAPVLYFALAFYYPGCVILRTWLPQYTESLIYLGILLPIIIFSSKVNLLTNNFLKVYGKEKLMLLANAVSILLGLALFSLTAYLLDNLTALLICTVAVSALNFAISEILVAKIVHAGVLRELIEDAVMCVGFLLCTFFLDFWTGFGVYLGLFALYCATHLKAIVSFIKKHFHKKPQDDGTAHD